MREYNFFDIIVFMTLAVINMFSNYSIMETTSFLLSNLPFLFYLPIDVFFIGFVEPLNVKDNTNRQGTLHQYVLVQLIKRFLPLLEEGHPSYSFISNAVWKRFFDYRAIFQAWNGVENSYYEELKDNDLKIKGLWIKASCRPKDHDVVLFYIPNFIVFGKTPHFYTEYLLTLHSLLILQGFRSPAIFVPQLPMLPDKSAMFPNQLKNVLVAWEYVTSLCSESKYFVCGDSSGGNLALSFLLFRQNPDFKIFDDFGAGSTDEDRVDISKIDETTDFNSDKENEPNPSIPEDIRDYKMVRPFGVLLISPILKFKGIFKRMNESGCSDFLSTEFIDHLASRYVPESISDYDFLHSPGFCNNINTWKEAFPEMGVLLIWGNEELLAGEISEFGSMLSLAGSTKKWKANNKIHSWPFMSFTTEDAQDEKEDSCFAMAAIISRMTLWHTPTYLDPETAQEPMNLLTIDDDHL